MENANCCVEKAPSFMEELEKTWQEKIGLLDSLIVRMEEMMQRFEPKPMAKLGEDLAVRKEQTESIPKRLFNQTINVGGKLDHAHGIMNELDKIV